VFVGGCGGGLLGGGGFFWLGVVLVFFFGMGWVSGVALSWYGAGGGGRDPRSRPPRAKPTHPEITAITEQYRSAVGKKTSVSNCGVKEKRYFGAGDTYQRKTTANEKQHTTLHGLFCLHAKNPKPERNQAKGEKDRKENRTPCISLVSAKNPGKETHISGSPRMCFRHRKKLGSKEGKNRRGKEASQGMVRE